MARQLIYTSAPKLLDAGRSGFGTVARSKSLSPLLVGAIERVSQFANHRGADRARVIFTHRRMNIANQRIHLLSRIADAGSDYTGRTNHLAQHLVVSQDEAARAAHSGLTPADVLQQFSWLPTWTEPAKFLDASQDVALEALRPLGKESGRTAWTRLTGHGIHARLLAWHSAPRTGVLLVPSTHAPLALLAEALAEAGPLAWNSTFTTSLESTDDMADLDWILSSPENFPEIRTRCGIRTLYDLTQPGSLPLPTEVPHSAAPLSSKPPAQEPAASPAEPALKSTAATARRTSVPHPAPRPIPQPRPSATSQIPAVLLVSLVVAALVLLGILFWPKAPETPVATPPAAVVPPTPPLTDAQLQAGKDLQKLLIPADKSQKLVKTTGQDAPQWVNFIASFHGENAAPPFSTPPATIPVGSPAWLESLVAAQKEAAIAMDTDATVEKRTAARNLCLNALKSASIDLPHLNVESLATQIPVPKKIPASPTTSTPTTVSAPTPAPPSGPDFSKIPEKSLLCLTQEQIRQGVKIPLLTAHISSEPAKKLIPNGVSLTTRDGKMLANRTPDWMEKGPWFDTGSGTVKISRDGQISAASPADADGLQITSTAANSSHVTWIVLVDDRITTPVRSGLTFSLTAIDANSTSIHGDLTNWLLALDETSLSSLKIDENPTLTLHRAAQSISIHRPAQPAAIKFSDEEISEASNLLRAFQKAENTPSVGTKEQKTRIQEAKIKAIDQIKAFTKHLLKEHPQMPILPELTENSKSPDAEKFLNPIILSASERPPAPLPESLKSLTLRLPSGRVLFAASSR